MPLFQLVFSLMFVTISLFASEVSIKKNNIEKLYSNIFSNSFVCNLSSKTCTSSNLKNDNVSIKNIIIQFSSFPNFNYDKKFISNNAKLFCKNNNNNFKHCVEKKINKTENLLLLKTLSNVSNITIKKLKTIDKNDNNIVFIDTIHFTQKNLLNILSKKNLTLDDFKFNFDIDIRNIHSNNKSIALNKLAKKLESLLTLPQSTNLKNKNKILTLNKKILNLYSVLFDKIKSDNKNLSQNIKIDVASKIINNKNLMVSLQVLNNNSDYLKSKIYFSFSIRNILSFYKMISKMDVKNSNMNFGNLLSKIQLLGTYIYLNNFTLSIDTKNIYKYHKKLLNTNTTYKNNFSDIKKILNNKKLLEENFKIYKTSSLFKYDLLSFKNREGTLFITNNTHTSLTALFLLFFSNNNPEDVFDFSYTLGK